ncbi:MAG: hydrogenase large subunit [Actinomycetes bacterium]
MRHVAEHRRLDTAELPADAAALLAAGMRLSLVAGHDDGEQLRIVYLFLDAATGRRTELEVLLPGTDPRIPSLAGISFPAGRFERELHDLFGIIPEGHPLPRRLVRHPHWPAGWYPMRHDAGEPSGFDRTVEPYPFLEVTGTGVYEIPVGPVHAGLIEPGHFRLSVVGETVLKLKARLWFVHRGMERLFEGRTATRITGLAEKIAGDTSVGHGLAATLAVEDALGWEVPEPAQQLRAALLEMERLYNHVGDIGALANDVGYGIINAHALRIRERLLRINEEMTGHRLLRGAIIPGGVQLLGLPTPAEITEIAAEVGELAGLALRNTVVRDRFAGTAVLTSAQARDLGCLGYVARASGVPADARREHPFVDLPVHEVLRQDGDVLARFSVRVEEVAATARLLVQLLEDAPRERDLLGSSPDPEDRHRRRTGTTTPGTGIVEGWRGTIVHRVELGDDQVVRRVKVVDPSWFNWPAVPVAMGDTIVADFPLANKSFNLSYAANDL